MTPTQQRLWDRLADGVRVRYWPGHYGSSGHFRLVRPDGTYINERVPGVTCGSITAMIGKRLLVVVRRFDRDATSSGRNAAMELVRADLAHTIQDPQEATKETK